MLFRSKVADLTKEKLTNYWLAFNGEYLLEALKQGEIKPNAEHARATISGEGANSQIGGMDQREEPKSLLQRMSERNLGQRD